MSCQRNLNTWPAGTENQKTDPAVQGLTFETLYQEANAFNSLIGTHPCRFAEKQSTRLKKITLTLMEIWRTRGQIL